MLRTVLFVDNDFNLAGIQPGSNMDIVWILIVLCGFSIPGMLLVCGPGSSRPGCLACSLPGARRRIGSFVSWSPETLQVHPTSAPMPALPLRTPRRLNARRGIRSARRSKAETRLRLGIPLINNTHPKSPIKPHRPGILCAGCVPRFRAGGELWLRNAWPIRGC